MIRSRTLQRFYRFGLDAVLARQFLDSRQTPLNGIGSLRIQIERIQILLQRMAGIVDAYQRLIQQCRDRVELRIQMARLPQR